MHKFPALPTLSLALSLLLAGALDAADPAPTQPKSTSLKITFLPPPLEGTLSVGIFDKSNKLVRTLHSESSAAEFVTGLNGLITSWDGKGDSGTPVPSGKYRVRGLAVGDLELTGEAFHGNDWVISEDAPRPVRFTRLSLQGEEVVLEGLDSTGRAWRWLHSPISNALRSEPLPETQDAQPLTPGPTSCPGREGTQWSIEKILGEPIVVQINSSGEVARRLAIGAGEPAPVAIAAGIDKEEIFLLERDNERWRLRGLRRKAVSTATQTGPGWEVFLEKNRWGSQQFTEVAHRVGRAKPFASEAKVNVSSQSNPLLGGATPPVSISVGTDPEGSFLKTSEGLPLRRLTDTTNLRWAVLGHDNNQPELVLLQSDGSVVEEYRIRQPGRLMTFDAGEYQWPPK